MRVLEYSGLDTRRVHAAYQKVVTALERDDFRSAEVKKLAGVTHGKFFRARLDHANRLIFTLVRHADEICVLALEVVHNHAYEQARFLRGARVDEAKIPAVEAATAALEAEPVRYVHPRRTEIHLLDKVISFDDAQEAVYRVPPPAIVVGSAGSGKTALTLEKLKHAEGEVLYVTLSAYLAQSARDLYYAHGFEREGQDASFLSYRELVETIRVPAGREATWRDFAGWFQRQHQAFKGLDPHQAFEEIRGVIAANAAGVLSREQYRMLGVRQSIFLADQRDALYDVFEKYRTWLGEAGLYDLGLLAHDWRPHTTPRYDFVVVDEVQDLTNAQLALVLAGLRKRGHFLLCGDSNQIVHPNFFAWSAVKSLFWQDPKLAERQTLHVLRTNFRNGTEVTRIANTLLKIKHARFGSIDRETNYLVEAVSAEPGTAVLLPDKDAVKRRLDEQTRGSTRFAVLVLRDEDKPEAARHFKTPLVFSIHEAKGLEYEGIVLYRFVSGQRQAYAELAVDVRPEDLAVDELAYRRAADKTDKSLEAYKFFVNALYVALTRAVKHLYVVESDLRHPLLELLGLAAGAEQVQLDARASTSEEWQREARKLELQGKLEQAEAIRKTVLRQSPVPWPVFDEPKVREALTKVYQEQVPSPKFRHQLFEFAACQGYDAAATQLWRAVGYEPAQTFFKQFPALRRKHFARYAAGVSKDVLKECDRHGIDHRTPMGLTPLMTATIEGNVPLVETLLERGANCEARDIFGCNALHWLLRQAFDDPDYAEEVLPALYERLAPASIDLLAGDRLVRIDRHLSEYFLFQAMWALNRERFSTDGSLGEPAGFSTAELLAAYGFVPLSVLREQRRQRSFLSAVLSRNEVDRDYAYNRRLFLRLKQGWYQLNPQLKIRLGSDNAPWVPIVQVVNLPLMKQFCDPGNHPLLDRLVAAADLPPAGPSLAETLLVQRRKKARKGSGGVARPGPQRRK
ncbi:MAG: AAA family ATPase [Candidatus Sericytochromatia bacterium]|nr:AAA family ATPase [Candidatus Sericytochromatia bacterium]